MTLFVRKIPIFNKSNDRHGFVFAHLAQPFAVIEQHAHQFFLDLLDPLFLLLGHHFRVPGRVAERRFDNSQVYVDKKIEHDPVSGQVGPLRFLCQGEAAVAESGIDHVVYDPFHLLNLAPGQIEVHLGIRAVLRIFCGLGRERRLKQDQGENYRSKSNHQFLLLS